MYQYILIIAVFGFVGAILWQSHKGSWNLSGLFGKISYDLKSALIGILNWSAKRDTKFAFLRKFFYRLMILLFIILALTGFSPPLLFGAHLSGILLIIHVTIAPLFVFSFMLFVILWALLQQFDKNDFETVQCLIKKEEVDPHKFDAFMNKLYFWLFTVIALPAIMSMILSMYPIFGTEGQIALLNVHRYSVLALAVIIVLHLFGRYRMELSSANQDNT